MYFLRVDFSYRHTGVTRTRDLLDTFNDVVRQLELLRNDKNITILQIHIELCN